MNLFILCSILVVVLSESGTFTPDRTANSDGETDSAIVTLGPNDQQPDNKTEKNKSEKNSENKSSIPEKNQEKATKKNSKKRQDKKNKNVEKGPQVVPISEVQMLKNGVKRKCGFGQWLRRGKCADMVGIASEFSEVPNNIVSQVRDSLLEDFWPDKKGEPKRAKILLAKIEQKLKHGLAFHSERQLQGKPTCLLITNRDETEEQLTVIDLIFLEDFKSGREINNEWREVHLIHYYEHLLENISTLLFTGQTIHSTMPPKKCQIKYQVQLRIEKFLKFMERQCKRHCKKSGFEKYRFRPEDDYPDTFQAIHPNIPRVIKEIYHMGGVLFPLETAEDYPLYA